MIQVNSLFLLMEPVIDLINLIDPQLMTIATLTGHAVLAVGNYSTIMDNGPAKAAGTAGKVQQAGDKVGDMFEISTIRREDWDFIKDKSGEFVSVLQCNNAASSRRVIIIIIGIVMRASFYRPVTCHLSS